MYASVLLFNTEHINGFFLEERESERVRREPAFCKRTIGQLKLKLKMKQQQKQRSSRKTLNFTQ